MSCLLRISKWFLERVLKRKCRGLAKVCESVFCVWQTKILEGHVDGIRGCDDIPGWPSALPRLRSINQEAEVSVHRILEV